MQDALRLVKQQGYDLAMLTTRVPRFFERLGFREVPKFDGYECPATALARLVPDERYAIQALEYQRDWRAIATIYQHYSTGLTGMQLREARFWETFPRRGTFPLGFSSRLGAMGLLATRNDAIVAYMAANASVEQPHLSVTDLAHLRGHESAALALLQRAAQQFLTGASGRAVLHVGGNAPVVPALLAAGVRLEVEIGPGLMVLPTNREWLKEAGFRSADDATEALFRSSPPYLWQRDGY
jgi:hypothetical protein